MTDAHALQVDVAIIGGGPGGSTTATYLARAGLKVALFERERFPRFKIGESLLPLNMPILQDLGVMAEMDKRFIRKYAANFCDKRGARTSRYPFVGAINKKHPYAYEVERAEYDQMLLENAEKHGVTVYREWGVKEVLFEGERAVGLTAEPVAGGAGVTVRAPMVVDASGRSTFLGTRLGIKQKSPLRSRTAFFSHFENVHRDPGECEGDIQIVPFQHGWFWMIPFKGNTTSVGMVVLDSFLEQREKDNDAFLWRAINETPFVAGRMKNAVQKWPAQSTANFSYRMDRYAGNGWVLIGDAGAFLDPVFSSGVFLTMKSAQLASNAILKCFKTGDFTARHFSTYERRIREAQEIFFSFIHGWYDPAFLDLFFYSKNILGLKAAITTVLAADLFNGAYLWNLKLRIKLLFFITEIHRRILRMRAGSRSLIQQLPV